MTISKSNPPEPIRLFFLFGVAFFLSWGPGLQHLVFLNFSRLFAVLSAGLVGYWLLLGKKRFGAFPTQYNLFCIFILVHTVIAYLFVFPEDFIFEYTGVVYYQDGFLLPGVSRGYSVTRFFLLLLTAYAVSSLLQNRRELHLFALAYGSGFTLSLFLGGHVWSHGAIGFYRATGGFLNANALGLAGLLGFFLNLAVCLDSGVGRRTRAAGFLFILAGLYGILASVSRNSLAALACGGMVVACYLPLLKKIRWSVLFLCLLLVAAALLPEEIFLTIPRRLFTVFTGEVQESHTAFRPILWADYLRQAGSYFTLGLGLARATEAIRETYSPELLGLYCPHQTYLRILVEFGIVGLAFFLGALAMLVKRGVILASGRGTGLENTAMLGLLVALAVYGLIGDILPHRPVWIALGVIAFTQNRLAGSLYPESGNSLPDGERPPPS